MKRWRYPSFQTLVLVLAIFVAAAAIAYAALGEVVREVPAMVGKVQVQALPAGALKIYRDAQLTQEVTGAATLDFGQVSGFRFDLLKRGLKLIPVWLKNDAGQPLAVAARSNVGGPGEVCLANEALQCLDPITTILTGGAVLATRVVFTPRADLPLGTHNFTVFFIGETTTAVLGPGRIAFSSDRDGNYEIYVMNADGTSQTRLTNNNAFDFQPAWSPDGNKIAFWSDRDGNYEIYVMNADGSGQTRLTNNPASDANPSWSPDGIKIAFRSDRDGNDEIYVMNADGTGQTRLTNRTLPDDTPDWSPDGSKLSLTCTDASGWNRICVMSADGTNLTQLTPGGSVHDAIPRWSPDGKKIAFRRSPQGGNREIYVMNADGSNLTNLTNNLAFDYDPDWSPDGSKIAFSSDRAGSIGSPNEIYVMNADGSGQIRLTNNPANDSEPAWGRGP